MEYLPVSDDNCSTNYDEPTDFKDDSIKTVIPENKIFLDYLGFRTLDSFVRTKEIFGQDSGTIISQKFHNKRALYLATHFNTAALGFDAKSIFGTYDLKVK